MTRRTLSPAMAMPCLRATLARDARSGVDAFRSHKLPACGLKRSGTQAGSLWLREDRSHRLQPVLLHQFRVLQHFNPALRDHPAGIEQDHPRARVAHQGQIVGSN